jgi:hypothetical protein
MLCNGMRYKEMPVAFTDGGASDAEALHCLESPPPQWCKGSHARLMLQPLMLQHGPRTNVTCVALARGAC